MTRSDFMWEVAHPPLELLEANAIWIPNGEGYGGVTDRHAVLSDANYEDYLNILRPALVAPSKLKDEMSLQSNWNLERFIFHSLSQKQAKLRFFPYPAFSVRPWGGSTSWSKGRWSFKFGCFIKYASEYRELQKLTNVMRAGISWSDIISSHAISSNGAWAINALLTNAGHKKLFHHDNIVGLTFLGKSGTLGFSKSDLCPVWVDKEPVYIKHQDGAYIISSKKDGKFYCADSQNIIKTKQFNENCVFQLAANS